MTCAAVSLKEFLLKNNLNPANLSANQPFSINGLQEKSLLRFSDGLLQSDLSGRTRKEKSLGQRIGDYHFNLSTVGHIPQIFLIGLRGLFEELTH